MYVEDLLLFLGIPILIVVFIYVKSQKNLKVRLKQSGIIDIDEMDGYDFEQYLFFLFKQQGYRVKRTRSSNDFGADLILEGREMIVVQAKRYKSKVGIKAVQEINSARDYYKAQEAWVITNNYFTIPAIKLAAASGIKLIDRDELIEIILRSSEKTNEK